MNKFRLVRAGELVRIDRRRKRWGTEAEFWAEAAEDDAAVDAECAREREAVAQAGWRFDRSRSKQEIRELTAQIEKLCAEIQELRRTCRPEDVERADDILRMRRH